MSTCATIRNKLNSICCNPNRDYICMMFDLNVSCVCIYLAAMYLNVIPAIIFAILGVICYFAALKTTKHMQLFSVLIVLRVCVSAIGLAVWGYKMEIVTAVVITNIVCAVFAITFVRERSSESSYVSV